MDTGDINLHRRLCHDWVKVGSSTAPINGERFLLSVEHVLVPT